MPGNNHARTRLCLLKIDSNAYPLNDNDSHSLFCQENNGYSRTNCLVLHLQPCLKPMTKAHVNIFYANYGL